jgi:hypothetical protein
MAFRTTARFSTYYQAIAVAAPAHHVAALRHAVLRSMMQQLTRLNPAHLESHGQIDRLVEARQYRVLRMRPERDGPVQVRIALWVDRGVDVWLLAAGDKSGQEDTWYTAIARASEREVARIINKQKGA